jgi:hypothetical protein
MAGYLADVRKAKNYAEFKKMHPDVDITREGFLDLKRGDRRRRLRQPETLQPTGRHGTLQSTRAMKTPQPTGRHGTPQLTSRTFRVFGQPEAGFLNRHDGGMAKKTRTF